MYFSCSRQQMKLWRLSACSLSCHHHHTSLLMTDNTWLQGSITHPSTAQCPHSCPSSVCCFAAQGHGARLHFAHTLCRSMSDLTQHSLEEQELQSLAISSTIYCMLIKHWIYSSCMPMPHSAFLHSRCSIHASPCSQPGRAQRAGAAQAHCSVGPEAECERGSRAIYCQCRAGFKAGFIFCSQK